MKKNKPALLSLLFFILFLIGFVFLFKDSLMPWFFRAQEPIGVSEGGASLKNIEEKVKSQDTLEQDFTLEVIAENLNIPWELAFLPSGDILVTERVGRLINVTTGKSYQIENVNHSGEGGLLGMALHPDFSQNNYIYLYYTTNKDNRVERYFFNEGELIKDRVIFSDIPVDRFHNGGRIDFGPDGYLYITTGDALNTSLAQNINSLAGKILRLDVEGNIPSDNPYKTEIYSYGHRNPQGIAWDKTGQMWATEHGPTSLDELNLIEAGKNYGWPNISGDEKNDNMEIPILHSGYGYTWAPSGLAYFDNSLFFAGLRGQALYEAQLNGQEISELKLHFAEDFGRLRNVRLGPDNMIYILTNNTDGRGAPKENDDKLIKINPQIFR